MKLMQQPVIILGIDPGSRITGYGIIRACGTSYEYLTSGCIQVQEKAIPQRLQEIYSQLSQIILEFNPAETAIEQVFMHVNPASALKLGQARGAAIVAAAATTPVYEYSARQIKQAVVGHGAAAKLQVQHMVQHLLALQAKPVTDAADALAAALCHANHRLHGLRMGMSISRRRRARRWL